MNINNSKYYEIEYEKNKPRNILDTITFAHEPIGTSKETYTSQFTFEKK
jgi:hypothetical protein